MAKKIVFHTDWFDIEEDKGHYTIVAPDAVCVFALTKEGKVIIVEQFRSSIKENTLEIPSGYIDSGETAERAASRELLEETGYVCKNLVLLGSMPVMSSRLTTKVYIFYGAEAVKKRGFVVKEKIKPHLFSFQELERMIVGGVFRYPLGIAAFTLARLKPVPFID